MMIPTNTAADAVGGALGVPVRQVVMGSDIALEWLRWPVKG